MAYDVVYGKAKEANELFDQIMKEDSPQDMVDKVRLRNLLLAIKAKKIAVREIDDFLIQHNMEKKVI